MRHRPLVAKQIKTKKGVYKAKAVKARKYEPHRGPCPKLPKSMRPIRHTASSRDKCRVCGAQVVCEMIHFSGGKLVLLNPDRTPHKHQDDGPPIIPENLP